MFSQLPSQAKVKFVTLINNVGEVIANSDAQCTDCALALDVNGKTLNEVILEASGTIGEKLSLRRVQRVTKTDAQVFGAYKHMGGRIVTLVLLDGNDAECAKDIAMHIAALGPKYVSSEQISAEEVAKVEAKLAEVKTMVEEKGAKALTLMVSEGNLSVYGDQSRFALLYEGLGFKNVDDTIDDSTHGQTVTFEYIAEQNPEYLVVLDKDAISGGESTAANVLDNDIVKSTDAYKNDKIIYLTPAVWYTNDGGLNSIYTMIEDIEKGLK